jgi:hypothetical protein
MVHRLRKRNSVLAAAARRLAAEHGIDHTAGELPGHWRAIGFKMFTQSSLAKALRRAISPTGDVSNHR